MIARITRNIRPEGIRYQGRCYNSAPLQQLRSSRRGTAVVVHIDVSNLRSVYVLDDKTNAWIEAGLLRKQSLRSAVGLLEDMAASLRRRRARIEVASQICIRTPEPYRQLHRDDADLE
jgi:hypothetical protein